MAGDPGLDWGPRMLSQEIQLEAPKELTGGLPGIVGAPKSFLTNQVVYGLWFHSPASL